MTEKPILFSAPMVRAILNGTKTQTRRTVKPQPEAAHGGEPYWHIGGYRAWQYRGVTDPARMGTHNPIVCPYGEPGDRLWVREAWYSPPAPLNDCLGYVADGDHPHGVIYRKRPSIHMPRWASRITLEVTGVRVERLQDISTHDCWAEGIPSSPDVNPRHEYEELWTSINGPGSWKVNPWVWCIEFRRVTP